MLSSLPTMLVLFVSSFGTSCQDSWLLAGPLKVPCHVATLPVGGLLGPVGGLLGPWDLLGALGLASVGIVGAPSETDIQTRNLLTLRTGLRRLFTCWIAQLLKTNLCLETVLTDWSMVANRSLKSIAETKHVKCHNAEKGAEHCAKVVAVVSEVQGQVNHSRHVLERNSRAKKRRRDRMTREYKLTRLGLSDEVRNCGGLHLMILPQRLLQILEFQSNQSCVISKTSAL